MRNKAGRAMVSRQQHGTKGMWNFLTEHWRDGVEILILAALAYHGYLFFRATRGARILTGLLVLLLSLALISLLLELSVISSLLQRFSVFLAIALVIIFQPELRRVLAELGSSRIFSFNRPDPEALDVLMEAMQQLSSRRCGALFALKRGIDLKPYAESGVELDAVISNELVTTIFQPKTSLHDGGAIIDQGRISAAGCVFPVSQREIQDRAIGLRHRAGMGISEETDAIALVVSEETGALSLCFQGRLEHDLEPEELRQRINEILTDGGGAGEETATEGSHELGASS
ncbi:diadenylate cyclase CdaA [Prosthecobacter sp.]|uniref:diadenylate cyclase CdaA n=1 Tax=Prosthecobacter sp. TaxID=1965333 RepID=UPI003783BBCF